MTDVSMNVTNAQRLYEITGGQDLEAFTMAFMADRVDSLQVQLADQISEMKRKQAEINKLNSLITKLRELRPEGSDPGKCGGSDDLAQIVPGFTDENGKELTVKEALYYIDATDPNVDNDNVANQKEYDVWIEQAKNKVDNMNSESQQDTIRMQSLQNKVNQYTDWWSNLVEKYSKSADSIIGNMR